MIEQELVMEWAIQTAIALAIVVLGHIVTKTLVSLVKSGLNRKKIEPVVVGFVGHILNVVLLVGIYIAAIVQLGVDTTSLVAILGAAGLAVGFCPKRLTFEFRFGHYHCGIAPVPLWRFY